MFSVSGLDGFLSAGSGPEVLLATGCGPTPPVVAAEITILDPTGAGFTVCPVGESFTDKNSADCHG